MNHLMTLADIAIDLHSGGSSENFLDVAYCCLSKKRVINERNRVLVDAMGLPFTLVLLPRDTPGDFVATAQEVGCKTLRIIMLWQSLC